jgi:hypothetical protein
VPGERQARLELDRLLEALHGFLEALLQRQHAAEILVQVRQVRRQRDRQANRALGVRVAFLLAQRVTEQSQMIHGAGAAIEIVAADLLGAQRAIHAQRFERSNDARALRIFRSGLHGAGALSFSTPRYLSNHC